MSLDSQLTENSKAAAAKASSEPGSAQRGAVSKADAKARSHLEAVAGPDDSTAPLPNPSVEELKETDADGSVDHADEFDGLIVQAKRVVGAHDARDQSAIGDPDAINPAQYDFIEVSDVPDLGPWFNDSEVGQDSDTERWLLATTAFGHPETRRQLMLSEIRCVADGLEQAGLASSGHDVETPNFGSVSGDVVGALGGVTVACLSTPSLARLFDSAGYGFQDGRCAIRAAGEGHFALELAAEQVLLDALYEIETADREVFNAFIECGMRMHEVLYVDVVELGIEPFRAMCTYLYGLDHGYLAYDYYFFIKPIPQSAFDASKQLCFPDPALAEEIAESQALDLNDLFLDDLE